HQPSLCQWRVCLHRTSRCEQAGIELTHRSGGVCRCSCPTLTSSFQTISVQGGYSCMECRGNRVSGRDGAYHSELQGCRTADVILCRYCTIRSTSATCHGQVEYPLPRDRRFLPSLRGVT